jgi:hypothetical protein
VKSYHLSLLVSLSLLFAVLLLTACLPKSDAKLAIETPQPAEVQATHWPSGQLLKGERGEIYRQMEEGLIRRIYDRSTLVALGYETDAAIRASDEDLAGYPPGMPLTRWVTSQTDPGLYFLKAGKRSRVPDAETMEVMGGGLLEVSLVRDEFIGNFELEPDPLPKASLSDEERAYPMSTAAVWADGFLWTANETGLLTRWDVQTQDFEQYRLTGEPVIRALANDNQAIYAGTQGGDIWQLSTDGSQIQIADGGVGWVSALVSDGDQQLCYADTGHFDRASFRYQAGRGLACLEPSGRTDWIQIKHEEGEPNLADEYDADSDPLNHVSALAYHRESSTLWIGTRFAGLLGYDIHQDTWQKHNTFNSNLASNTVHDVQVAPDDSLWLATASGVSVYRGGVWGNHRLTGDPMTAEALSLAISGDNTVWVAGESFIAHIDAGGRWQVYHVADNPLLSDRIRFAVLDDEGHPWFIGRRGKIHFDGDSWLAIDADVRRLALFTPSQPLTRPEPPLEFPSPTQDYSAWLQTWPRPEADNGRGIHFLQTHRFDPVETQGQVNRLKRLGVRWTVVHYADHDQMVRVAPIFQEAGIAVIWRPFVRPYETYPDWAKDVAFLRSRGLAPYMQLYNEPSLAQEWDHSQTVDQETYLRNLLPAIRQVYDAGGYVGIQFVNPDWLRLTLQTMKSEGKSKVFERLFFIPHLYGLNHPPDYDEDINSVLGFREYAKIFEEEIGFVPVMIAGEGGWRPGEAQDNRYPPISEALHRDYHLAVFGWFHTGQLSNGDILPDYFFAFCPWLISDPHDPAAWFDSDSGDRTLTVEAVERMPAFERKFSWGR